MLETTALKKTFLLDLVRGHLTHHDGTKIPLKQTANNASFGVQPYVSKILCNLGLDVQWVEQLSDLTEMLFPGYNSQIWLK